MARGGKRENAGRKVGAVTKRTQEVAAKATAEGITPLEVMLGNMRFYYEAGEIALRRLLEGSAKPADIIAEHDPAQLEAAVNGEETPAPSAVDAFKLVLALRDKAGKAASDAARYCHAPIAAQEGKPQDPDTVPLADRLKAYSTRDVAAASGGKVVALKRK